MKWCEDQRMKWIGDRLAARGYINQQDLMGHFGVTKPQASKDLNKFSREMPGLMVYSPNTKRYEFNYDHPFNYEGMEP